MPFETFFESYKFFLTEYSDLFLTMGQACLRSSHYLDCLVLIKAAFSSAVFLT